MPYELEGAVHSYIDMTRFFRTLNGGVRKMGIKSSVHVNGPAC
jgi:hypothetical protein